MPKAPKAKRPPPSDRSPTGSKLRVGGRPLELLDAEARAEFLQLVGLVPVADAAVSVGWSYTSVKRWLLEGAEAHARFVAHTRAMDAYTDALAAFDAENRAREAAGRKPLADKRRPEKPPPLRESADDLLYRSFRAATRVAKKRGKVSLVVQIATHGKKNWKAAAFLLGRRFPGEWGRMRETIPPEADDRELGTLRVRRETPEETIARHAPRDEEDDE